jgi:hypothetical protein
VDDFVTWSEIEQKVQQVAKPAARRSTSSGNGRWGWAALPIAFLIMRLITSAARNQETPSSVPPAPQFNQPQPQFDRKKLEQMMQEAQKQPPENHPREIDEMLEELRKAREQQRPIEWAQEELRRARQQQEPMGPPKP